MSSNPRKRLREKGFITILMISDKGEPSVILVRAEEPKKTKDIQRWEKKGYKFVKEVI